MLFDFTLTAIVALNILVGGLAAPEFEMETPEARPDARALRGRPVGRSRIRPVRKKHVRHTGEPRDPEGAGQPEGINRYLF